jgi:pyruvate formate lyase activating enzyme
LEEIKKDAHYFRASGGGVTFSGGECLLQPRAVAEIARGCQAAQIHTAVESAFCVPWENVEQVLPFIDMFFADLKIPEAEKHRRFTAKDNKRILDNVTRLSRTHDNVIVRIPDIPGVNDSPSDIEGFAAVLGECGDGVKAVELLRYNHLAASKYRASGQEYRSFADHTQTDEKMQEYRDRLAEKCDFTVYFI